MIIKHIETGIESELTYSDWISKYVGKNKHKKFNIIESSDVVELHRILENGSVKKSVFDKNESEKLIKKFPNEFKYIENTFEYCDKYLINNNQVKSSFLNKIKKTVSPIVKPITRLNPVWRFIIGIITAGFGTFLGYLIIEYYKKLN